MEEKGKANLVGATVILPQFKDIRKSTPGETYKYLHELIKGKSIENLNELISSGDPLPLFDESLRLMLIDCLHLHDEVMHILLSQNEYQIKRILNCNWFFQNLSSETCTKELLPCVSQSLRCKIITKLSKHLTNTEEAEKCFTFVRVNYGKARADYLLPRCSSQFILKHFEEAKFTFKENIHMRTFFNICTRYPQMGIDILSSIFELKKKQGVHVRNYSKVLSYMSGHHPDLIVPFLIKYRTVIPDQIFGRKLTRKLRTKLKDRILPDFVEKPLFKENHLFGILSFEEKVKFVATVVLCQNSELSLKNWRNSDDRICRLLKLVPQDSRQTFVESAFREVYNSDFNENSSIWSRGVLELLPTKSRQPYVEKLEKFLKASRLEFSKNVNSDSFGLDSPEGIIFLYDTDTAFPKLKNLLRKTPHVSRRVDIVSHMAKNCGINKDVKGLENAVDFVVTHHRNDDSTVGYNFMEVICENFSWSELTSAIFEKLDDLVYFFVLRAQTNHVHNVWMERHIYYRLENGMDADDHVKKFFESVILDQYLYTTFLRDLRSKHSKHVVLALCKMAVDVIRERSSGELSENLRNLLWRVLETYYEFNKLNKRERILLQDIPGLSDVLRRELKVKFGEVGAETWSLDIWERYYNSVFSSYYDPRHLLYSLKRNQVMIEKHMEWILNVLFSDYGRNYNAFLNYFMTLVSFLGKTDRMKELILKEFKNGVSTHRKKNALALYSRACTLEEFTEAIREYLPKQEKFEKGSSKEFDEIQVSIPSLIKNVTPRWKNLNLIMKFYFLRNDLSSFFSCCHHTRCDVAIPHLKQLLKDRPEVSYKKHIIRLILQLSDRKDRSDFCRKGWQEHEHYSIRSLLLRENFNLFLEQPSRDLFQSLEKCILECDDVIIAVTPPLREIPEEFCNDYFSALWRFSEDKDPNFKNEFRRATLSSLDRHRIGLISTDLCEMIIKRDLFISSSEIGVERFAALYLAADPQSVRTRVQTVLDLIWARKADATLVGNFFRILIETSREHPVHYADVFEILLENWPMYHLGVLYKLRILFTYHNLHQKVLKRTSDPEREALEFGKELKKLYAGTENLKDLIPIYSEPLSEFFWKFRTENAIRVLKELVTGSRERCVAVLAVTSLPDEAVRWYRTKENVFSETAAVKRKLVKELVDIIESYGDDVVEIYLRSKFEFSKTELLTDS